MLPQLRELEARRPDLVAVVGVHSGKYIAERVTARIREACARMEVTHPVVNDRQFRVWRAYAVRAWPTLVAVDPEGYVVGQHSGEFLADELEGFVERVLGEAREKGTLRPSAPHEEPDAPGRAPGVLRYPGKVAVAGDRIAIADTGHHRIVIARLEPSRRVARVERVVGNGARGLADGPASEASFALPQGLAFGADSSGAPLLWVADAGNHALRAIRLDDGAVQTAAGTGRRVRTRADVAATALASPWEVTVAGGALWIAMAGLHQLWSAPLHAMLAPAGIGAGTMAGAGERWGSDPDLPPPWLLGGAPRGTIGSGAEEIHDGPAREAALAQPMALVHDAERGRLWFADAESSAIRWAMLDGDGAVGTAVGTGLFDFGDKDGEGDDVRLEHPQGLALSPSLPRAERGGRLLIADSYNDALKWLDPATRRVTTWLRGFSEPTGVAIDGGFVFIADTDAHRVAVVPLDGRDESDVRTLDVVER